MGAASSTVDGKDKAGKLLEVEIFQIITSELQKTIENANAKSLQEKAVQAKRTNELITLQDKFADYRKLVEETKDQMRSDTIQLQNSLEEYKQKFDKSNKEKQDLEHKFSNQERTLRELNEKCNKTEKDLNKECELRKSLEKDMMQMKTLKRGFETQATKVERLESELNNTRNKLLAETKLKQELETQLKRGEIISSTTKTLRDTIDKQSAIINQLQESLVARQQKLDSELKNKQEDLIKFNIEKQLSIKLQSEKNILMCRLTTIETEAEKQRFQSQLEFEKQQKQLQEVTEKLSAAQKFENLEIEKQLSSNLKREKEYLIKNIRTIEAKAAKERRKGKLKFEEQEKQLKEVTEQLSAAKKFERLEIEKQLSSSLRTEKDILLSKIRTIETEADRQRFQSKLKFEEQEKKLKEMTEKLTATQKINRLQVKLKKEAQAELSVLDEKNSTIKQLEAKLEEKEKILCEYLNGTQQKAQEEINKLQLDTELCNFLKMSEEARSKELQEKDLEQDDLKLKHESNLRAQLRKFNSILYKLKMTEKERDQQEQLRKEVEGKLNLLEDSYSSIKGFCEKELRERKDFLEDFEKCKQKSKEKSGLLAQASTSKEPDSLLTEKMALEAQLDSKTNEIALLKQQLKLKETEMQSMACEEHSNNKRSEMASLHEEFMESLKKFNQN